MTRTCDERSIRLCAELEVLRSYEQIGDAGFEVVESVGQRRELLYGAVLRWLAASQSYTGPDGDGATVAWFMPAEVTTSSTSSALW